MKAIAVKSTSVMALLMFSALSLCFSQAQVNKLSISKNIATSAKLTTDEMNMTSELSAFESSMLSADVQTGNLLSFDLVEKSPLKGYVKSTAKNEIVNVIVYPLPENGMDLSIALSELIEYPQEAIEDGVEGVVKILCMVERDGSVSSVVILEDIGGNCASEVCKVLRSVKLKPATQNGVPRRCPMVVPVRFNLT